MQKAKAAVESSEKWSGLRAYLDLVEANRETEPGIALGGAKSLLEGVSKTVLADRGITYADDANLGKLVKTALRSLPSFAVLETQDASVTVQMISGLGTVSESIGALRNRHSIVGHGQDLHDGRALDKRLANLAIDCADNIAGFLMDAHTAEPDGMERIRYEDCEAFNNYLDDSEEHPIVAGVSILPSKALFSGDLEAYKENLNSFFSRQSSKEDILSDLEKSPDFISTRRLANRANDFQEFFTDVEVERIASAIVNNPQIYRIIGHGFAKMMYEWVCDKKDVLPPELATELENAYNKKIY